MKPSDNSAADHELVEELSERELEILDLMAENLTNQEIADSLILSLNTVKWYARQIYEKLGVDNRRAAVRKGVALDLIGADQEGATAPTHNLPAQITPFWGRERELAELTQLIGDPACRLLTITGHGGMGKTRVALQLAKTILHNQPALFPAGIFFVSLAEATDLANLVSAIATALGFRFYQGAIPPEKQLSQFLQPKQGLILLDNLEGLISPDNVRYVARLLAEASGLKIMATSRVPLNLQGEQIYLLHGLDIPDVGSGGDRTSIDYGSIQLFIDAARRANPAFTFNEEDPADVIAICQFVEGIPLAIELAAAWTAALPPDAILQEIKKGLDFLASSAANVPQRQRSLPIILNGSWQLLTAQERQGVEHLSIFPGGFTAAAARRVADVSMQTILGLVSKSWLQQKQEGHFHILELLRQYGSERLSSHPAAERAVRERHSEYYCHWIADQAAQTAPKQHDSFLKSVHSELENVRSASLWAAQQGSAHLLNQAVPHLGQYYRQYGGFSAGERFFVQLAHALPSAQDEKCEYARAQIMVWRSTFHGLMGKRQSCQELIDTSRELLNSPILADVDTRHLRAQLLLQQGYVEAVAKTASALPTFVHSYELYEEWGDETGMTYALIGIGRAARNLNQPQKAEQALLDCLQRCQNLGDPYLYGEALSSMGSLYCMMGRLSEAEKSLQQSLQIISADDHDRYASALFWLARTYHASGQFRVAASTIEKSLTLRRDQGLFAILTGLRAGAIYRDLGDYGQARAYGKEFLLEARTSGYQLGEAQALGLLGSLDLIEGKLELAHERLRESVSYQDSTTGSPGTFSDQAFLGITLAALGQPAAAAKALLAELTLAYQSSHYIALLICLAGFARLRAMESRAEEALELYALARSQPYIRQAYWIPDIIGQYIFAHADDLTAERVTSLETQGTSLDLWQSAAVLLQEGIT